MISIHNPAGTLLRAVLAVLAVSASPFPVHALTLEGKFTQGGMVLGKTDPSDTVFFEGKTIRVSPSGVFIIGFDRDAPRNSIIDIRNAAGAVTHHPVTLSLRTYDIQRIDGLKSRWVDPSPRDLKRIRAEAEMVRRARLTDDPGTDFLQGFAWPVKGRITGVFGSQRILNGKPRQPHYGVDIAAPRGTPVKAPAPGIVTLAHPGMFFTGGTLIIDHGHGLSSAFLHLHTLKVQKDQRVQKGQTIATVGATGRVTGPHLDWRVNWFENRLDPALLVNETDP